MGNFLSVAQHSKNLSKLPIICSSCGKNYLLRFKKQRYIISFYRLLEDMHASVINIV
jgi:hypothetical protein